MTKLLVKTYFKGNGGLAIMGSMVGRGKKRGKGAVIASYFGIIYISLLYMFIIFTRAVASLQISAINAVTEMQAAALTFSILFTLTSVDNVLVRGRDLPLLRTLPITEKQLVLSRFVILYTEAFVEGLMVFLPFVIASILSGITNVIWYLLIAVDIFILPAFSVCFMAIFSYLGARYRLIYRIKTALIWILASLLVFVMLKEFGGISEDQNFGISFTEKTVVSKESILLLSLLVLITAILSLLFFFADTKLSRLALEPVTTRQKSSVKKNAGFKQHTLFNAMFMREWRIIFSHSAITTEILMELFIPAVLMVVYAVMGMTGKFMALLNIPVIQPYMPLIITGIIMLCYIFCLLSSTSVSREGKDYEIAKTYPVTPKTRVDVKIAFHMAMVLPVEILFLIISYVFFSVSLWQAVMLIATVVFINADFSALGLAIDFRNPHTEWERPQEAVKQNMNGLGASGLCFLIFLILISIVVLIEYFTHLRILSLSVSLLISAIMFPILRKISIRVARETT